jgi:ATP-dependent Clp protease ATP-binding subunit ClpA
VHALIASAGAGQERVPTSAEVAFSFDSQRALNDAREEADRLAHHHIGAEHLLLAILRQEGSLAGALLTARGMSLDQTRAAIASRFPESDRWMACRRMAPSKAASKSGGACPHAEHARLKAQVVV